MMKKSLLLGSYVAFFMSLLSFSASSSSATYSESLNIDNAWALFGETRDQILKQLTSNNSKSDAIALLSESCSQQWGTQALQAALYEEAKAYSSDVGLKVRAGVTSGNLSQTLEPNDGATYAELSWDLLDQGLKNNRIAAEQKLIDAKILALQSEAEQLSYEYQCRHYQIGKSFAAIELKLLEIKKAFMLPILEKEKEAYFSGDSYLDELFLSDEDVRQVNESINVISELYWLDDTINTKSALHPRNPPVILLNLDAIIAKMKHSNNARKLKDLHTRYSYLHESKSDNQLRVFIRQEFEASRFEANDLVAGVRFTMPLGHSSDTANQLRLRQELNDIDKKAWLKNRQVLTAYQKISEQAERVTKQQFALLRSNERLRRIESYRSSEVSVDPVAALVRLRTYIDGAIELIHAKKELYQRIATLFAVAKIPFKPEYLEFSDIDETTYRARPHTRLLMLNEFFGSQQLLQQLMKTKGISALISKSSPITNDMSSWRLYRLKDFSSTRDVQRLLAIRDDSSRTIFDVRGNETATKAALELFVEEASIFASHLPIYFLTDSVVTASALVDSLDNAYILVDLPANSAEQLLEKIEPVEQSLAEGRIGFWLPEPALVDEISLEQWIDTLSIKTTNPLFIIDDISVYLTAGSEER